MTCLTQRERSLLWPSISFFLPFLLLWAVGLCGGCEEAQSSNIKLGDANCGDHIKYGNLSKLTEDTNRRLRGSYVLPPALSMSGYASPQECRNNFYFNKIADAIYRVENSKKYPYGIKSINTHGDPVLARKICLNTIRNNYQRWLKAGKPGDYLSFLGNRYAPLSDSPLNKNWLPNLRRILG